jgi:hypothetical protein
MALFTMFRTSFWYPLVICVYVGIEGLSYEKNNSKFSIFYCVNILYVISRPTSNQRGKWDNPRVILCILWRQNCLQYRSGSHVDKDCHGEFSLLHFRVWAACWFWILRANDRSWRDEPKWLCPYFHYAMFGSEIGVLRSRVLRTDV